MHDFRTYLQQEFVKRTAKNSAYSLRSFALQLGISHATLSSMLSGKRKITPASMQKIGKALNLGPAELQRFTDGMSPKAAAASYFMIQQDAFALMSEWYFDAILELSLIPHFRMEPVVIAQSLEITSVQAKIALDTLERLELLMKDPEGRYKLAHLNSVNILDSDFTSTANRKYQKSILEKSTEALEKVDRKKRDHTSTTMAINAKDLQKAKELIQKFRHELNAFLQRSESSPDEVYQLQISFFPLTQNFNENDSE